MNHGAPERARLAWDAPARVCHWGLALSLTLTLLIGFRCDPQGELFKFHIPLGCLAAWFLLVRAGLGFFGCPLSRWAAMCHSPATSARYLVTVFRGGTKEPPGLNPGTALFAPLLFAGLIGALITGYVADWGEEAHEPFAWGLTGLIGVHLLGLFWHAIRHRALTPLAMIHGKRSDLHPTLEAATTRRLVGSIVAGLSAFLAWTIWTGFDPALCVWHIPGVGDISFPLVQKG